jgi:hypothetical protein
VSKETRATSLNKNKAKNMVKGNLSEALKV